MSILATLLTSVSALTLTMLTPDSVRTCPQGATSVAIAEAARYGEFEPLDAAVEDCAPAAERALVEAQRFLSRLDLAGAEAALDRYDVLNDADPSRRRLAFGLRGEAAFVAGDYASAAEAFGRQVEIETADDDGESLGSLRQTLAVARLLSETPPQQVIAGEPVRTATTRDMAGLMRAPATIGDQPIDMVIDTGANLSVLSKSAAERFGVRVLEGAAAIGSSTRSDVAARIGVADRMTFAGLTFSNVVFIVLDDDQLSFPNGYRIDGIVGFPLMYAAGGVTLSADGDLTLAPEQVGTTEADLRISGSDLLVAATVNGLPTSLHLDSGASHTNLTSRFANRHAPDLTDGARQSRETGGAGGVVSGEVVVLSNAQVTVGGQAFDLPGLEIEVSSEGRAPKWPGTLGQDILGRVDRYSVDLRRMKLVLGAARAADVAGE